MSMFIWSFSIVTMWIMLGGGIVLLLVEYLFADKKGNQLKTYLKKYAWTSLRGTMCWFMLITIGVTFGGPDILCLGSSYRENTAELKDEAEEGYRVEDSLANNIELVSKVEQWEELTDDVKKCWVEAILRIESRYLGEEGIPSWMVIETDENVGGYFDCEKDMICISRSAYEKADGYEVLRILCHEMLHRSQKMEVEFMQKIMADSEYEKYQDMWIFQEMLQYEEEFDNYSSFSNSSSEEEIEAYFTQTIEYDAYVYSSASVEEYKKAIDEYLDKNGETKD